MAGHLCEVRMLHRHEGYAGVHVFNDALAALWVSEGHCVILRAGPTLGRLKSVAAVAPAQPATTEPPEGVPDVFNVAKARGQVLSEIAAKQPEQIVEASEAADDITGAPQ